MVKLICLGNAVLLCSSNICFCFLNTTQHNTTQQWCCVIQKVKTYINFIKNNGMILPKYSVIQKDGLNFIRRACTSYRQYGLNSKRCLDTRQTVVVFQVFCSLYGLTCVGYAQNSLEFVSRSLITVVGRNFCLYTNSLFAQIGDSSDECSSSLEVECWNVDETHAVQQSPTQF